MNTTYFKIIALLGLLTVNFGFSQIAIGKPTVANSSVLLDFGTDGKGIILPSVDTAPGAVGGTFIFNTTENTVQVWEGKNTGGTGGWTNLTVQGDAVSHSFINAGSDTGDGVIIGASSSSKPGVLVLESTDKAMVLPLIASPHLNMVGAIAGTMVYDTDADMIAIYDGANWNYWK